MNNPLCCFWNVQRLGQGSCNEKKQYIIRTLTNIKNNESPNNELLVLMCEVVGNFPINYNGWTINVQAQKKVQSTSCQPYQLGYAAFKLLNNGIQNVGLEIFDPNGYNIVMCKKSGSKLPKQIKKGQFRQESKREVVKTIRVRDCQPDIYMYHADSGQHDRAAVLVQWVAKAIAKKNHNSWILVGDFNCNFDQIQRPTVNDILNGESYGIIFSNRPTFRNKFQQYIGCYDYAISDNATAITHCAYVPTSYQSSEYVDHAPIVIKSTQQPNGEFSSINSRKPSSLSWCSAFSTDALTSYSSESCLLFN